MTPSVTRISRPSTQSSRQLRTHTRDFVIVAFVAFAAVASLSTLATAVDVAPVLAR